MPYRNYNKNKDKFPWLGQIVVNGKQKRKQFASKQAAVKWEVDEKARMLSEDQQQDPIRTVCLHDWATAYLDYAKARFSPKTYDEKRFAFLELFGRTASEVSLKASDPIECLTSKAVLAFLQDQSEKRSGYAANKQRKNLRAAWQWGIRFFGLSKDNPFDSVQRFAEERNERTVPTIDDFWRVYAITDMFQDKVMLLFCLHTGARRDEVFRLRWKDVDFSGRRICLHTKKK